jgi:hypothetical protein
METKEDSKDGEKPFANTFSLVHCEEGSENSTFVMMQTWKLKVKYTMCV